MKVVVICAAIVAACSTQGALAQSQSQSSGVGTSTSTATNQGANSSTNTSSSTATQQSSSTATSTNSQNNGSASSINASITLVQPTVNGDSTLRQSLQSTSRNEQVISGEQKQTYEYTGSYTIKNVPNVNAPPLISSNDTCMGSASGGVAVAGFGLSGGSTYTDEHCKRIKMSRELWNKGMKAASLAMDCMDRDAREALELTGYVCPQTARAQRQAEEEQKRMQTAAAAAAAAPSASPAPRGRGARIPAEMLAPVPVEPAPVTPPAAVDTSALPPLPNTAQAAREEPQGASVVIRRVDDGPASGPAHP